MIEHMTPKEILIATRARIVNPIDFTRGTSARDDTGAHVHPNSPEASCWCLLGAMIYVCPFTPDSAPASLRACHYLQRASGSENLAGWSDINPHVAIIRALDDAILLAEKDERNEKTS
jgi:hypothetical protein